MDSRADHDRVLRDTRFLIDQVNGRIFNRDFLPYRFSVDSVALNVQGTTSNAFWGTLSEMRIHLINPDTSFTIVRGDSLPFHRIHRIETFAANRDSRKIYDIQLNIFQQDPFLITWEKKSIDQLPSNIEAQTTLALNNYFFTYYIAGGTIGAVRSANNDGATWTNVSLDGLTASTQLTSAISVGTIAFVLDDANNVFRTTDGIKWSAVNVDYPVEAIYGVLPSSDGGDVLLVVDNNGTLTFAKTDDFSTITLFNPVPAPFAGALPVVDFSAVQVDNPNVYAAKFIILAGGETIDGLENRDIWLMEYSNGNIRLLRQAIGLQMQRGSRMFYYNNQLQMMVLTPLGENLIMFSTNYGLSWEVAGERQFFPGDFTHRTHPSIITDDEFIWIFGGQTPFGEFSDAWRGRLNLLDGVL